MPAEGHTGETVLRFLSDFDTQRGEGHIGVPELKSLSFNSLQDYAGLVKQFDFTSVDLGAAKGLIDQLAGHRHRSPLPEGVQTGHKVKRCSETW